MKQYYGTKYFNWQSKIGEFGGWANLSKFIGYIKPSDRVIDFGCGGGYLLKNITCSKKIGVEVNESARKMATVNGIQVYPDVNHIKDEWADIIISNHALEHTVNPFNELIQLKAKLKQGGKVIFVVPSESYRVAFKKDDISQHLYTWSPLNLGNLFQAAGYQVLSVKPYFHKWRIQFSIIRKLFGDKTFHLCAHIYGWLSRRQTQVILVAKKP